MYPDASMANSKARNQTITASDDELFLDFEEEISAFFSAAEYSTLNNLVKPLSWWTKSDAERISIVQDALDNTERCDPVVCSNASATLLYIAIGCPNECESQEAHCHAIHENVALLIREGVLSFALRQLFSLCFDDKLSSKPRSMVGNADIRTWAGVCHSFLEVVRSLKKTENERHRHLPNPDGGVGRDADTIRRIIAELSLFSLDDVGVVPLCLKAIHTFVDDNLVQLPVKKLMMVCWKSIMVLHGDLDVVATIKADKRKAAGLAPTFASDIGPLAENMVKSTLSFSQNLKGLANLVVVPHEAPNDGEVTDTEDNDNASEMASDGEMTETEDLDDHNGRNNDDAASKRRAPREQKEKIMGKKQILIKENKRPFVKGKIGTIRNKRIICRRKVTPKQLEELNAQIANRPPDLMMWDGHTFQPPRALQEAKNILESNVYISLRDVQIEEEEKSHQQVLKTGRILQTDSRRQYMSEEEEEEKEKEEEPVETLFKATVELWDIAHAAGSLTISLLKLILAAIATYDPETKSTITFDSELHPTTTTAATTTGTRATKQQQQQQKSALELAQEEQERIRHGEILMKSLSAMLLLVLKHFHVNHVYQMEYVASKLHEANGIVVLLKALNVNSSIDRFTTTGHRQGFFASFWGDDATERNVQLSAVGVSSRNVQCTVSLLRILQKLTKNKHSRIVVLVQKKAEAVCKRLLRIQNKTIQLYILKLIKTQVPLMNRMWKSNNMHVISAIDLKVTHGLKDVWFETTDEASKLSKLDAEEKFNVTMMRYIRRYLKGDDDTLADLLEATSIFDLYQLEL
eukprot:m.55149 g.55149  ORF g.55149 m.55149 type:complete len:807 (+) comp22027_c2_seq1:173-2593(+)